MMNAPLRPGTRPVGAAQLAVKDTSTKGPVFAATPVTAYLLTYLLLRTSADVSVPRLAGFSLITLIIPQIK